MHDTETMINVEATDATKRRQLLSEGSYYLGTAITYSMSHGY